MRSVPESFTKTLPRSSRRRSAVQPFGNVDQADMIDDDRRLDRGDEVVMIEHALAAEMHGDVPAVPRHCLDDPAHVLTRHGRAKMSKMKMQADAAHTGLVEPFDLRSRHIGF